MADLARAIVAEARRQRDADRARCIEKSATMIIIEGDPATISGKARCIHLRRVDANTFLVQEGLHDSIPPLDTWMRFTAEGLREAIAILGDECTARLRSTRQTGTRTLLVDGCATVKQLRESTVDFDHMPSIKICFCVDSAHDQRAVDDVAAVWARFVKTYIERVYV